MSRLIPATPEQRALVDALIAGEWLNRRYLRLEAHLWEACMPSEDRLRPGTFLCQALKSGDHLFDKLARHKNSALRNYHIALRDLERLKKEEHKQELAATSPEPVAANSAPIGPQPVHPIDPPPPSTPIGFVPSNHPSGADVRGSGTESNLEFQSRSDHNPGGDSGESTTWTATDTR